MPIMRMLINTEFLRGITLNRVKNTHRALSLNDLWWSFCFIKSWTMVALLWLILK